MKNRNKKFKDAKNIMIFTDGKIYDSDKDLSKNKDNVEVLGITDENGNKFYFSDYSFVVENK